MPRALPALWTGIVKTFTPPLMNNVMDCKRIVFVWGMVVAAVLPANAGVANLQEATYWLEGKSQQLVRQSRATMNNSTAAFAPQAGPIVYDAFWLRDYAYMVEGCPEAFTQQELKDSCTTFVNAVSASGVGCCLGIKRRDGFCQKPLFRPYGAHNPSLE